MPDTTAVPGTGSTADRLKEIERLYPGLTLPVSVWHANEIIKRLDRLIELQELQLTQGAAR